MEKLVAEIKELTNGLGPVEALSKLAERFEGKIAFSTSFGLEDQAITHLIFSNDLPIKVFTLDTGRMFKETYRTWEDTVNSYGKPIHSYAPKGDAVEALLTEKGPYSFYRSVENRKECCGVRKVEPLGRALDGIECWITGIRADQSANREDMSNVELDAGRGIIKFHPIFDWSFEDTKTFIKKENVPFNVLHDRGFPSIGCEPCTRAVKEGEDFRAGRWWWEDRSKKECGLHEKK